MPEELEDVPFDAPVVEKPKVKPAVNGTHESFEDAVAPPRPELTKAIAPLGVFRSLPHSVEAETGLLGCCLIDEGQTLERAVREKIASESFYDTRHSVIFACMVALRARREPIAIQIVAEELKTSTAFHGSNVYVVLVGLTEQTPTTAEAGYFIERVRHYAARREIIRAATAAVEEAHDLAIEVPDLTENLRRRLDFGIRGPLAPEIWPDPVAGDHLQVTKPIPPAVLIDGILYDTGTMLVAGPSKAHKTFTTLDCSIAISNGTRWLGYPTAKSPVIYLNLELQHFAIHERALTIASARGERLTKDLIFWNLRGRRVDLDQLAVRLPDMIQKTGAKVVCIDPHYKVSSVSDMEENSNDQQGKLLTLLEGLCAQHQAALILTHHFAKGDASNKNAIDRASGGGVFARWGDVMLTMTPHEEQGAMTIEMSLRNFAPVAPFVVRWAYPRWVRDKELDPEKLQTNRGPKERHTAEDALRALGDQMLSYNEWQQKSGIPESTFRRKRQELVDSGRVLLQSGIYRAAH